MDRVVTSGGLVLGTAQWGGRYGIANREGVPGSDEVEQMVALAGLRGVRSIDTARAYGDAEEVVGRVVPEDWYVLTKLAPDVATVATPDAVRGRAGASLDRSRTLLRRRRLDTVLLHRPEHLDVARGAAWDVLREEQSEGSVGRIGVSAVSVDDAEQLLTVPGLQVVQVPASILDQRLVTTGFFARAAALGVEVYVRSVYLQGVAHLPVDELPAHLEPVRARLVALDEVAADLGVSRGDLFLTWARDRLPGTCVVVGCETVDQVRHNLDVWETGRSLTQDVSGVPLPDSVLDPWRWPR